MKEFLHLPKDYLIIAEKFNLMPLIDRWVVKETLKLCQSIEASDVSTFFINLSAQSISNFEFCQFLEHELKQFEFPHKICFEITETVAINNFKQVKYLIQHLKKIGCQFALDDFGSGFNSFGYLKELDIDFIKIDGLFIKDIVDNHFSEIIVTAILQIAKDLNILTIAECIESETVLKKVTQLGIHFGQGFYIKHPHSIKSLSLSKLNYHLLREIKYQL